MEWIFKIHTEERYIEVITSGVVDGDCTVDMAKAIAKTMINNQMTRALIDHRNVEAVLSNTFAAYNRPKVFRFIGLTLGIKLAEIIRPDDKDHFKFFESICENQGYRLSVFEDKDKALTWLLE